MENVNNVLLNLPKKLNGTRESENAAAGALQREKNLPMREMEEPAEDGRIGLTEAFRRVTDKKSTTRAVTGGFQLGLDLRRQIAETSFDSGTFYTVLILAIVKDILDCCTLGVGGTLVNIAISAALFIIFFMRSSMVKRFLIKRFIWPIIITIVSEFIPFLDIFPAYTVMTILLKLKMDKMKRVASEQLEKVEKDTKNLVPQAEYENYQE